MNQHIRYFNNLVNQMLNQHYPDISFTGVYNFLDRQGLLDKKLIRNNDDIHLGKRGVAQYVAMMKSCVFRRLKFKQYARPPQEARRVMGPPGDP